MTAGVLPGHAGLGVPWGVAASNRSVSATM